MNLFHKPTVVRAIAVCATVLFVSPLFAEPKERGSRVHEELNRLREKYKIESGQTKNGPITSELSELAKKENEINEKISKGELTGDAAKEARASLIREAAKTAEKMIAEVAKTGKVAATQLRGEMQRGGLRQSLFEGTETEKAEKATQSADILSKIMSEYERIGKNEFSTPEKLEGFRARMKVTADRAVALGLSDKAIEKLVSRYTEPLKNAAELDAAEAKGTLPSSEVTSEGGISLEHVGTSTTKGGGRPKATTGEKSTRVGALIKILEQAAIAPEGLGESSEVITDKDFLKSTEVVAGIMKMGEILEREKLNTGDNDKAMEKVWTWLEKIGLTEKERALLCKTRANPNPKCNTFMCKQPGV